MDPAHHGISRELERVDLYKGKVDKALKLGGPTTKLDVPAAERMINAAKGGKKKRGADKDEAEELIEEAMGAKKKGDKKKKKKLSRSSFPGCARLLASLTSETMNLYNKDTPTDIHLYLS